MPDAIKVILGSRSFSSMLVTVRACAVPERRFLTAQPSC
jgi:hypothetical protein